MTAPASGGLARFLTPADAAQLLAVSLDEVFSLITSGELPAIRVAQQWRIEHHQLETYIADRYEETRRMALWNQAEFADLADFGDYQRNRSQST